MIAFEEHRILLTFINVLTFSSALTIIFNSDFTVHDWIVSDGTAMWCDAHDGICNQSRCASGTFDGVLSSWRKFSNLVTFCRFF